MLARTPGKKLGIECLEEKTPLAADMASEFSATVDGAGNLSIVNVTPRPDLVPFDELFRQDITLTITESGAASISAPDPLGGVYINGQPPETIIPLPGFSGDVFVDFGSTPAVAGEQATFELMIGTPDLAGATVPGDVNVVGGNDFTFLNFPTFGDVGRAITVAGDVSLATTRGVTSLIANGTVFGDDILIDASASDGVTETTLLGVQVTDDVRVTAGDGGLDFSSFDSGIQDDLVFVTGAGDDEITIESTIIGDDILLDTGAGGDLTTITDSEIGDDIRGLLGDGVDDLEINNTPIGDDAIVDGGADDDFLQIIGGDDGGSVGDDVFFRGGGGQDQLGLFGEGGTLTVGDDVTLIGGADDDEFFLESTNIAGNLNLFGGAGADMISAEVLTVGVDLRLVTSGGDDEIEFVNLNVADDFLGWTGSGDDTVIFSGAVVEDLFFLSTGSGDDDVTLSGDEDEPTALDLVFIDLGEGDDGLTLDGLSVSRAAFFLGDGDDTLEGLDTLDGLAFTFGFEPEA